MTKIILRLLQPGKRTVLFFSCWLVFFYSQGQSVASPDSVNYGKRLKYGAIGLGIGYSLGLGVLSKTWYSQSERTRFHFFNDSREWLQLDKAGHFWGAFHESRLGVDVLRAARLPEIKAILYGGLLGFVLQSPIELLDGYAADYGASSSDLVFNAAGSLAVIVQQLAWQELRLIPKYSFHRTGFARLRPNVLGRTLPEELLKDYNGQTYWLSASVSKFISPEVNYPNWLNIAIGYGGENMVYGSPDTNKRNGFNAYRQYYLALDIDLTQVKTRHRILKKAFYVISTVHLPAPTVGYNREKGFTFHPLYF